jgi:hypothetical protein
MRARLVPRSFFAAGRDRHAEGTACLGLGPCMAPDEGEGRQIMSLHAKSAGKKPHRSKSFFALSNQSRNRWNSRPSQALA